MNNRQEQFNLKGWKFIFTFGRNLDIYRKGRKRVGICNGKLIILYKVKRGSIEEKELINGTLTKER